MIRFYFHPKPNPAKVALLEEAEPLASFSNSLRWFQMIDAKPAITRARKK